MMTSCPGWKVVPWRRWLCCHFAVFSVAIPRSSPSIRPSDTLTSGAHCCKSTTPARPVGPVKTGAGPGHRTAETIEHRLAAHHGHYADARANLDDSLHLLAHVGDIYAHADDANRRLCNQALFKAIYIDEESDVRVGYRSPYVGLANTDPQADALTWAAQARKQGQDEAPTKGGLLVESSHLTHLG